MFYNVHIPPTPLDPRRREFDSLEAFTSACPELEGSGSEAGAVTLVRVRWPDALCMPVAARIGSGSMMLLGILPSIHAPKDPTRDLPFVAFVRASAEDHSDKKMIKRGPPFDRDVWRVPVDRPVIEDHSYPRPALVEVRGSDLDEPRLVHAEVGLSRDHKVLVRIEINGVAISVKFEGTDALTRALEAAKCSDDAPSVAPTQTAIPEVLRKTLEINRDYRTGPQWVADLDAKVGRDTATEAVQARDWYANGPEYSDRSGVLAAFHPLIHKIDWPHIVERSAYLAKELGRWIWLTLGEDRWARIALGSAPGSPPLFPGEEYHNDQYITTFSPTGEEHFVGCS